MKLISPRKNISMKNFLGSSVSKAKSFLGKAYNAVPHIHRGLSLGLKVGSALRPLLQHRGHHQIADAIHHADSKYHRISDKVEGFYNRNKNNIDKIMNYFSLFS
jgi:hypothetical protein